MAPSGIPLIPLLLLGALAFDLADGDCVSASREAAAATRDAGPSGACSCCIASEGAAEETLATTTRAPALAVASPPCHERAGVRPVLYHPPQPCL